MMTPEQIVRDNLDSYNKRDIDGFMSTISEHIELYNLADFEPTVSGFAAVKHFYQELFTNSPGLHSKIVNRIVIGNKVIDHENIVGRNGESEMLELVLVYETRENKIFRITVIREADSGH